MSRENVEIVKRILPGAIDMVDFVGVGARFGDDASGLLAADAEIVFLSGAPGVPDLAFRGLDGFEDGWRDWLSPFSSYMLDLQEVVDAGDDEVLVLTHVRARTHRDDVLVEHDPAAAVTVRDGQIVRVRFFLERSGALEALGLTR